MTIPVINLSTNSLNPLISILFIYFNRRLLCWPHCLFVHHCLWLTWWPCAGVWVKYPQGFLLFANCGSFQEKDWVPGMMWGLVWFVPWFGGTVFPMWRLCIQIESEPIDRLTSHRVMGLCRHPKYTLMFVGIWKWTSAQTGGMLWNVTRY